MADKKRVLMDNDEIFRLSVLATAILLAREERAPMNYFSEEEIARAYTVILKAYKNMNKGKPRWQLDENNV